MNKNPEIQFRSPEEIKAIRKAGWLRNCFICRIIHDSTNICSKHITSIYNR